MALPIHYDCDPGQDDAIALLYALGSSQIDVKSITVVGGNADVEQCARNARQILELAGRTDIPVFMGAKAPLVRTLKTLPEIFGPTGMAGAEDLPEPQGPPQSIDPATDFGTLAKYPTLVATGPLTNIALHLQANPGFASRIDHLYVMGGCPYPEKLHGRMGNYQAPGTSDYAEYNFAADPEAASIVFRAGIKNITMVGLNITQDLVYDGEVDRDLRASHRRAATKAADILSSVGMEDKLVFAPLHQYEGDPVRAIHDVVAMATLDAPELFEFEILPIRIIKELPPAPGGQSLIDPENPDHPAVRVTTGINRKVFFEKMLANIGRI